jgi:hypothetical protein
MLDLFARLRRKLMSAPAITDGMADALPNFGAPDFKAKFAAALYFFSLLTAASGGSLLRGGLAIAAGEIAVVGMAIMTLLLYDIFKPVSPSLSMLAASVNLVGLGFELLRWNPRGVDVALVFVGVHHLLIGSLIFKSTFLPRILGLPVAIAGLGWLTYVSPRLADSLSPYNTASGLVGEGLVFLWLLVMGVNAQRWTGQANWRSQRAVDCTAR